MNNPSNYQHPVVSKPAMSVAIAILVGQLVVNFPALVITLVVTSIGIILIVVLKEKLPSLSNLTFFLGVLGAILVGPLVGWLWWSFSVPRWRKWALQNGAIEDKLQKWAVLTGLVWPKGSIFEKTESKLKE
jgi:hypothetical protein